MYLNGKAKGDGDREQGGGQWVEVVDCFRGRTWSASSSSYSPSDISSTDLPSKDIFQRPSAQARLVSGVSLSRCQFCPASGCQWWCECRGEGI